VKSYQKKLNLTKPDTYKTDLNRKEAYTTYSNLRGFIYQNKDKQNRLMRIDELHKFSDGTLNDVRTALDDHLKGIRMKYFPQTIWKRSDKERVAAMIRILTNSQRRGGSCETICRRSDKERAAAMIHAIDKQLKTRRIMRSLEKFIGGRLIIAVTELQIVKWHNYKHLDWITVRRDDEKLYKFKEGDLKRLRIQDIKDMLLLLVQGKL
nr:hypothetical protein [Tanacetum cinerariifolium]GFB00022.1 hypothetical protein [Tanacetum cinerariifolium]